MRPHPHAVSNAPCGDFERVAIRWCKILKQVDHPLTYLPAPDRHIRTVHVAQELFEQELFELSVAVACKSAPEIQRIGTIEESLHILESQFRGASAHQRERRTQTFADEDEVGQKLAAVAG